MRRLSDNYWNKFRRVDPKSGKFVRDGLKFEDLVEELLRYKFPYGTWHRTKKTHDNNRDFYLTNSINRIWAECKNFSDNVSLKIIAPTLIMAKVYSVNQILFFSYSPINKKTRERIALYAEKTNSIIKIFDSCLLDEMIIDFQDSLSKRFKPIDGDIITGNSNERVIDVSFYVVRDILFGSEVDNEIMHTYDSIDVLDRFSTFEIIIYIDIPDNDGEAEVYITIPEIERNRWFENLHPTMETEKGIRITTLSQCICIRIPLRPRFSAETVVLPLVKVQVNCNGTKMVYESPNKETRLQWNNEIELIGNDYRKCVDEFNYLLIERSRFCSFSLYGKSGIGKSRILRELRDKLIMKGYRIISFIGTASEDITIILREIIASIYDMPSVDISTAIEDDIFSETVVDNEYIHVYKVLQKISSAYNNDSFDEVLNDTIAHLIAEKAAENKVAIIIDDLQKYGDIARIFFSRLIEYASAIQRSNRSILLFSCNTESTNGQMIDFMSRLFNVHKDNECFITKEITGFSTGELESFIRNLLGVKDERFSTQLKMIGDRYNNPYMIKAVIGQLISTSCIILNGKALLSIPRLDVFKETIENLPLEMSALMVSRYNTFIKRYNHIETDVLSILSLISLLREVTRKEVIKLSLNETVLDHLCEDCIIRESVDGKLSFYHDQFEMACIKLKGDDYYRIVNIPTSKEFIDHIKSYTVLHVMYSIEKGVLSWQQTKAWYLYLLSVRTREVCSDYIYKSTINYILREILDEKHGTEAITLVMNMCYNYRNNYGYEKSIQMFNIVYKGILSLGYEVLYKCSDFRTFVDSYSDTLRTVSKSDEALRFLNEICASAILLPEDDNKNALLAMAYNREMIVYRDYDHTISYETKVFSLYKKSMDYAAKISDYSLREEMIYINESDLGYLYYTYKQNYYKLISLWNKCLKHNIEIIPSKVLNIYRKTAQLCLIKGDIDGARLAANNMREYLINNEEDRNSLIFNLFIKKLDAVCGVLEWNYVDDDKLENVINEAMSMDMIRNPMKAYDSFTIKGIYFYYKEDYNSAIGCFNEALSLAKGVQNTLNRNAKVDLIQQNIDQCIHIINGNEDNATNPANGILRTKDGLLNLPLLV